LEGAVIATAKRALDGCAKYEATLASIPSGRLDIFRLCSAIRCRLLLGMVAMLQMKRFVVAK